MFKFKMHKIIHFFLISLFISSCSNDKSADNPPPFESGQIYYAYGEEVLPGTLPDLNNSYRPANLSAKTFTKSAHTYAPLNFLTQDLQLTFNVQTSKAIGKSIIKFKMDDRGHPYFELRATVLNIKLDGVDVSASQIQDPDGQNEIYWTIDQDVNIGATHELEVNYELSPDQLSFVNGGVRLLTNMTDLSGKFFEYWGPVGFEGDVFSMTLSLKILNSSSHHELYTNGDMKKTSATEWEIKYPDYYSKSSFYIHFTNATDLVVKHFVYQGMEKSIPVTVYSLHEYLVDEAIAALPSLFAEFESDFGPYAHESFIAYMNPTGGGMEYVGATITSLGALDHELFHSWFARSVIPADGRSGWIDEAFASWRDYGYFQAPTLLSRIPTNLANYSPFKKTTPRNCYVDGRQLMAELDREFLAFGGMKPLMRKWFERYKNRVVTNEEFWNFLNVITQKNIDAYFQRYTLGNSLFLTHASSFSDADTKHPHPLTQEEILRLR